MNRTLRHAAVPLAATLALGLLFTAPARGHETDQYTLPHGRQFADMGPYLNVMMYDAIDGAVKKVNGRIASARKGNRLTDLANYQSDREIVHAVNSEFPNAMVVIEGMDARLGATSVRNEFPGQVPGYKEPFTNIYQHAHFILDPRQLFRIWLAKTFVAYDVYMGGDKIGHFTDMGMNYWRAYDAALKKGANEEEATRAAVNVGTEGLIFSEKGMLGYLSAGSYSNGDMLANYLGFVFYRNLTSPMMLNGRQEPAMLVRDGDFWAIAPHVQRDNDFFAVYIDDYYNEVLNPSHYESGMRGKIREAIKQRQPEILERYADANGLRRSMEWFNTTAQRCFNYYGVEYGHRGDMAELLTVSNVCFDPLPPTASPGDRNDRGYTPLHDAVIRGETARIDALLSAGADVNAVIASDEPYSSEWGATPLHLAARDGRPEIVQALLRAGAKVDAADDRGATPLHYAAYSAATSTLLLERGANADAADKLGRTPLHWAASLGRNDSIDALVSHGAKVNQVDRNGRAPLHLAAERGDVRSVARLLDAGADANVRTRTGVTPLHLAVRINDPEAATVLLDHGADATIKDRFGVTPLHEAARTGRSGPAQALLDHGAQPNATDIAGVTPLHLAARNGHESTVQALLAKGADVNTPSVRGVTPLHEAAFGGQAGIIASLTEAGSNRSARDDQGRTPRDVAAKFGHTQVLALLAGGADSDRTVAVGAVGSH